MLLHDYCMSAVETGDTMTRKKPPEDVRIGTTLQGFITRDGWNHDKLATAVGVTRPYITQIVSGQKHLNNRMLGEICRAMNLNPLMIKLPDLEMAA